MAIVEKRYLELIAVQSKEDKELGRPLVMKRLEVTTNTKQEIAALQGTENLHGPSKKRILFHRHDTVLEQNQPCEYQDLDEFLSGEE